MQRRCLIVHQRMHRRNHHHAAQPDALAGQRRNLATQALAATLGISDSASPPTITCSMLFAESGECLLVKNLVESGHGGQSV